VKKRKGERRRRRARVCEPVPSDVVRSCGRCLLLLLRWRRGGDGERSAVVVVLFRCSSRVGSWLECAGITSLDGAFDALLAVMAPCCTPCEYQAAVATSVEVFLHHV